VVSLDPLREEAHVELMRLLVASGDAAGALVQYARLERLLREQLETTPAAGTRELADQIRSGFIASPAALGGAHPTRTVTFLATTARSGDDPSASARLQSLDRLPASEVLLHEIRSHGGHSVQADGDNVTVVFHSAGEALLWAIDTHRGLAAPARRQPDA